MLENPYQTCKNPNGKIKKGKKMLKKVKNNPITNLPVWIFW